MVWNARLAAVSLAALALVSTLFFTRSSFHSIRTSQLAPTSGRRDSAPSLIPRQEAIKQAATQLGLDTYDPDKVSATVETLPAETIPFLGDDLAGKKTWALVFHNVALPVRISGKSNSFINELKILLAPESGNVLSVCSTWPAGEPAIPPPPPAAEFARQMKNEGMRFTGLPQEPAKITLRDALLNRSTIPWGNDVRQIIAFYVCESSARFTDRPLWVVQLRGFSPFDPVGGPRSAVSSDARNHLTNEIDAMTGQWLSAGTTPQPIFSATQPLRRD